MLRSDRRRAMYRGRLRSPRWLKCRRTPRQRVLWRLRATCPNIRLGGRRRPRAMRRTILMSLCGGPHAVGGDPASCPDERPCPGNHCRVCKGHDGPGSADRQTRGARRRPRIWLSALCPWRRGLPACRLDTRQKHDVHKRNNDSCLVRPARGHNSNVAMNAWLRCKAKGNRSVERAARIIFAR
jgi:hypothetical protein